MLSKEDVEELKLLAMELKMRMAEYSRHPTLYAQHEKWVQIIYKVLKQNKQDSEDIY